MFRMKKEPKRPSRKKIKRQYEPQEGENLASIADNIAEDAILEWDSWGYDGGKDVYFVWFEDEPLADLKRRELIYEADSEKYHQWKKINADKIQVALDRKKKQESAAITKKRLALEKSIKKAQKELDKL
jgi:hypothetical protein